MLNRFSAGAEVASRGSGADANFQGRVNVWGSAWTFFQLHPLGTFGSPQFLLGQALDNEYVRVLLQGGVVFLAGYLALLLGGMRLLVGRRPATLFIGAASIALAINSITATPLSYPATGLFWVVVGGYLGDLARQRKAAKAPEAGGA
jgi:O-antigen ligase